MSDLLNEATQIVYDMTSGEGCSWCVDRTAGDCRCANIARAVIIAASQSLAGKDGELMSEGGCKSAYQRRVARVEAMRYKGQR